MKKCPFCKADIITGNDICPHCHRVIIERFYSSTKTSPTNWKNKEFIFNAIIKKIRHSIKFWKLSDFKKYIPILTLFILVIFLSISGIEEKYKPPVSVIPKNEEVSKIEPKVQNGKPKVYISLPNGTYLSKNNVFFRGFGQLKIDNWTNFDAVAKLVNTKTNKSVLTFYVQANNTYTIKNISNGKYKLFFNLGNDWDKDIKAFARNSSYELFEESFDFSTPRHTEGEYIVTEYSTFSVTLNPVVGGNASTERIGWEEFSIY